MTAVTVDADISIPVFVNGNSQSVFLAGDSVTMTIGGQATAEFRFLTNVLSASTAPYTKTCTAVGDGDGFPDSCTIGDGSSINSTPAGTIALNFSETYTGAGLAPFLINDSVPKFFLDVEIDATANGELQGASVWARTFSVPGAEARITFTYQYTPPGADSDGDGLADESDNCIFVANAGQQDADADGYGNACDADLNNDGIVNAIDLGLFRSVFFTTDAVADFNSDGIVNTVDLGIMRSDFFQPPGPSAFAP